MGIVVCNLVYCIAGIIVAGLEENQYQVNETSLSLSVCAVQFASIERDVGVVFSTESQSAICKTTLLYM